MKHEKVNNCSCRRRRQRVRNRVKRDSVRPRMSAFRSLKHIYVQIIDDENGKTLASASTADKEPAALGYGGNCRAAEAVGKAIAEPLAAGIQQVAFDRREYRYHGRVAALVDAARRLDPARAAEPEPPPKEEPKKSKSRNHQPIEV